MDRLPDKAAILAWIADNPDKSAKRDLARAFGIKGAAARVELKRILRDLADEGEVRQERRVWRAAGQVPPVTVLRIDGPDAAGDLFAHPAEGGHDGLRVLVLPRPGDPALGAGDRVLARLTEAAEGEGHSHTARLIRKLDSGGLRVLGIFRAGSDGGRVVPVDKGETKEWRIPRDATHGAKDGELVEAEAMGPRRLGLPQARVLSVLGDPGAPRAVSLIAIRQHGLSDVFPAAALAEAEAAEEPGTEGREDLRALPFVTIDPPDARDRDDAVYAEKDGEGWTVWVAIADVAAQVRPGSALDREARARGNSTYFPDRVVPMLPDRLSGDLCSLHAGVDRAVLAVRLAFDAHGQKVAHRFCRGVIRSVAALHYAQVQAAVDGHADDQCAPLMERVLRPLYAAYAAAAHARDLRQPLDLDLPERRIEIDEAGRVVSVAFRERLEAHRLIEEFMVAANVAAAEDLVARKSPLLFRVHEEPSPEKLDALREVAEASGFVLARGQVLRTAHLNRLLAEAAGTDHAELMNITTLRSMQQAFYLPQNLGHFGLALRAYAHFTSPIRRYADLIVHRALIAAHGWGGDGLSPADIERLEDTAKLISEAERRSMAAERDTTDRYLAAYLADRAGQVMQGRISGVQRFGLFVKLDDSGADGLVPIREVGREFFHYDPDAQVLTGSQTGTVIGLGQRVTVRLTEAVPVTGGILLELLEVEDRMLPGHRSRAAGAPRRGPPRDARKARRVVRRR
jgi:ribonuclease R